MSAALPIELTPPDLSPYRRGNTGVDYVTTFTAPEPGPRLVINALIHGNEICGAIAIDALFRMGIRPKRGSLTLALSNVAAYESFDRSRPFASRHLDEDMNRVWGPECLRSTERDAELTRARELRPVFESADALLDLHSMAVPGEALTLCGTSARARELGERLGRPRWIIADSGHPQGRRLIDFERFVDPAGRRVALLVECGRHWDAGTGRAAVETALRFLRLFGAIDPDPEANDEPVETRPARVVEVRDKIVPATDRFAFIHPPVSVRVFPKAGTPIARDGDKEIRTPHHDCALVLPTPHAVRGLLAGRLGAVASQSGKIDDQSNVADASNPAGHEAQNAGTLGAATRSADG